MVGFDADALCFFLQLGVFNRGLESDTQRSNAICRHVRRDEIGTTESGLAEIKIKHGALLVRLGEIGDLRHAECVQISSTCGMGLHQHAHASRFAAIKPAGVCDGNGGPCDTASAMHFATVNCETNLARARIAGDDFEFRVQHIVDEDRIVSRRRRLHAAHQQFFAEQVFELLHGRINARDAEIDVIIGAAEIDEFRRIIIEAAPRQERLECDR